MNDTSAFPDGPNCSVGLSPCGSMSLVLLGALVLFPAGCADDSLDSLRGRWDGKVICAGGQRSDISAAFTTEGGRVRGSVFTTLLGSRKEWGASGSQISCRRFVACPDDTCSDDAECKAKHFTAKNTSELDFGNAQCPRDAPAEIKNQSRCSGFGQCEPCITEQTYNRLLITLEDSSPQFTNPVLDVARDGASRLSGTLRSYCPDEELLGLPQVVMEKDQV